MRWIPDNTGRFDYRPYYEGIEMEDRCAAIIREFAITRRGALSFPIKTDDLTVLIEQYANLDSMADLSQEGEDVEGLTEFGTQPTVRISERLWEPKRENRLRTTLTHELGHVVFHNPLWLKKKNQIEFEFANGLSEARCHREAVLGVHPVDWMEWQAGYACGAFLMPYTAIRELIDSMGNGSASTISDESKLVRAMQELFHVSEEAAKVRLAKVGYASNQSGELGFFL